MVSSETIRFFFARSDLLYSSRDCSDKTRQNKKKDADTTNIKIFISNLAIMRAVDDCWAATRNLAVASEKKLS